MANESNQPFCIFGSKGRFYRGYEERGYLPALVITDELLEATMSPWEKEDWKDKELIKRVKLQGIEIQQLRGELLFLRNKLNEHLDKSGKPKHRGRY